MKHLLGLQVKGVLGIWYKYVRLSKTAQYPVRFLGENPMPKVLMHFF